MGLLTAAIIILFLLLAGWWLFSYFYPNEERGDMRHAIHRRLNRSITQFDDLLALEIEYIEDELALLGKLYADNPAPPSTLGPPGSLYVRNQTGLVYYNVAGTWGVVFNVSASSQSVGNCSVCSYNHTQFYEGPWNASVVYQPGDIVELNQTLYITNTTNVTIVVPGTNTTIWQPYLGTIPGVPGPQGPAGPQGATGPDLVFLGNWNASVSYPAGGVVDVNGTLYLSLLFNNTGNYPPSNQAAWSEILGNITMTPGQQGAKGPTGDQGLSYVLMGYWNGTQPYVPGDVVIYNQTIFTALLNNTGVTPGSNSSAWLPNLAGLGGITGAAGTNGTNGLSYVFKGNWSSVPLYLPGNEVTYNGALWVANVSSTNAMPGNSSAWTIVLPVITNPTGAQGANGTAGLPGSNVVYSGVWNASQPYQPGQLVQFNETIYGALLGSTGQQPGSNSSAWQVVVPPFVGAQGPMGINGTDGKSYFFRGNWNATQSYVAQTDYVVFGNLLYLAAVNSSGVQPVVNSTTWTQASANIVGPAGQQGPMGANATGGVSYTFEGIWNASQTYLVPQYVVLNGTLYLATNESLGVSPPNTLDWAYVLGPIVGPLGGQGAPGNNGTAGESIVFVGNWNNTAAFVAGDIVIYQGAVWLGLQNSTGSAPSNVSSVWQEIIPPLSGGFVGTVGPQGQPGANGTAAAYVGAWQSMTTYGFLNVVLLNSSLYMALTGGVTDMPSNTSVDWQFLVGQFGSIQGPQGPMGRNGTNGISYSFVGRWNASLLYLPYQEVVLSDGSLYAATASGINQYPVGNPAFWMLLYGNISGITGGQGAPGANATFSGTWNATLFYLTGNVVIYNNEVFYAERPNIGVTPGTNSSVWTTEISQIPVTGPQGIVGPAGPNNGGPTIRIQGPGAMVQASPSVTYATMNFTGLYNQFYDSTGGDTWGNFTVPLSTYTQQTMFGPVQVNFSQIVIKSEVSFQVNYLGGTSRAILTRLDGVGTLLDGTATSGFTLCPTNGYAIPNNGQYYNLPVNQTYSYIATIKFECWVTTALSNGRTSVQWSCASAQFGSDVNINNYNANTGSPVSSLFQSGSLSSMVVSGTNVLSPVHSMYFKITIADVVNDVTFNVCPGTPTFCTNQPLLGTHNYEPLFTPSFN